MQMKLLRCEAVRGARFFRETDMAFVAFDADQCDLQAGPSGRGTGIIEPASPSTAQLHDRETIAGQINRAQYSTPFRYVGMPICRDGNAIQLSVHAFQHFRKEPGINDDVEEVNQ